jgi:O-acetyl-ADP-ribose deacetylase (regulator of RNase III)
MTTITWTHPSVIALVNDSGDDPTATIERRARDIAFQAMEAGWIGPPYDPFQLAEILNIDLVARQDLEDARLVSVNGSPRIEFNPARRAARVRFSIAHEIGHFLFSDYAVRPRYRGPAERRGDEWQLEMLCNVAAAELLMPVGAFPIELTEDLSLQHLLDLRARFEVSTEALLRRAVKLTDRPAAVFAAARVGDNGGFRLDYLVGSRAWAPRVGSGEALSATSVLSRCTAVGYSDDAPETWGTEELHVQAVGVPPYPGDRFPRLVGLVEPLIAVAPRAQDLRYVRRDASDPLLDGPAIIGHVVNDRARGWGGRGFAVSLMERFPDARSDYAAWASTRAPRLGDVHLSQVAEQTWVASLVAQSGYGSSASGRPRIRLGALRDALETLANLANEHSADVHMPAIGTGQGGGRWPEIRDLILEELASRQVATIVYVLPDAPMPDDAPSEQMSLL